MSLTITPYLCHLRQVPLEDVIINTPTHAIYYVVD